MDTLAKADPQPSPAAAAVAIPVARSLADKTAIDRAIVGIAFFKLAKGIFFLLMATAALRLWSHDVNEVAHYWMRLLGIKQESRYINETLEHFGPMVDSWRRIISPLLFFYAAVFFTEGGGLLLRKHWAEWLTIIVTASLIPLELYELFHKPNWIKVSALLVNVGIVWFLVLHLRKTRDAQRGQLTP
ncbi:MAG: DUF2127 domain-containing protein [Verrucomicrobia bacterium]|nr:DUF2127 domain-containing protein [Verrucomicrobiota bacterium]